MSANVALSETFDQWRVKTNELLVMTQTDGSSNFIKLSNSTDSSSNTTGSIITAGGIGVAKSMTIGNNLNVHGNIHANGAISADGNLTLGDSATDTVSFSADINSNFVPDANVTFDLGSTAQHWANLYVESVRATQNTTSGIPAVFVSGNDTDVKSVDVVAGQTTANAVNFRADSLTTGSVLTVTENSSDTSARKVLSIVQDHVDGYQATALDIQSDGGRKGIFVDKNYTNTLEATGSNQVFGVQVDVDQTSGASGQIDVTGLDIDSSATGGSGTGTNIGIKSTVSGTATKYAGIFTGGNTGFGTTSPDAIIDSESGTGAQLRLGYSGTVGSTFTVGSDGVMTIDKLTSFNSAKVANTSTTATDKPFLVANNSTTTFAVETQAAVFLADHASAPPSTANRLYANTEGLFWEGSALATQGATVGKAIAITIVFG